MVKNNTFLWAWDDRAPGEGRYSGTAISVAGPATITNNIIGFCDNNGIYMTIAPDRTTISNNVFFMNQFSNLKASLDGKNVVVDGVVAWTGGANVGDEYLGESQRFGDWRDTQLRIEGPAALSLSLIFQEDWLWATGEVLEVFVPEPVEAGDVSALVMATGPADKLEVNPIAFGDVIGQARKRLWIVSPYFVPDTDMRTALYAAEMRGVDVRIMLPAKPDHLLVWLASNAHADAMVEHDVGIYRYQKGFLHQKVLLMDDKIAAVGSVNFDNRSFAINFEMTVWMPNKGVVEAVEAMLLEDFAHCKPVTRADVAKRGPISRFIAQAAPRGYGDAVLSGRAFVGEEPFLHLVGDHLHVSQSATSCARQLLDIAAAENAPVSAVQPTRESQLTSYGAVGGRLVGGARPLYQIESVLEKPTPTIAEQQLIVPGLRAGFYLCFFGMHVLGPAIFTLLEEQQRAAPDRPLGLSPALHALAARQRYLAFNVAGRRFDVGAPYGLLFAQLALSLAGRERDRVLTQLVELLAHRSDLA